MGFRSSRTLVVALTLALAGAITCDRGHDAPPDLLLVTVDSLRADFLGCYGGEPSVGRRMCALGDHGIRYAWAFSPSSSSAPAIASILTSRYPNEHGVGVSAATFLHDDFDTLAEELSRAGYATAAFVSSPELNRSRNLQQGFDVYDDHTMRTSGIGLPRRSAEDTTDAALAWLKQRDRDQPWFVWIHYREPHGPYDTLPAAAPGDEGGAAAGAGERLRVLPTAVGRGGIPSYQAIPGLFTRQGYEARYRAEIRHVDGELARLLIEVERRAPRLGVLVTADHGEAFGEDRWYLCHGQSLGLEQIRVPLIWRPPGGVSPDEIRVAVSTLDVAPTLLRSAGVAIPESFRGWLLPGPDDPPGAPEQARAIFAVHPRYVAVVSGNNYYARLREPLGDVPPGMTPEYLRATAARTASLSRTRDSLPPYEDARPSGITPLLEPMVADFLAGREP